MDEFSKYMTILRDMDPQCKEAGDKIRQQLVLLVMSAGKLYGVPALPCMLVSLVSS